MTGDLSTNEFVSFGERATPAGSPEAAPRPERAAVLHEYGRLTILDAPTAAGTRGAAMAPAPVEDMTETERLGAAALAERNSEGFKTGKRARVNDGLSWGGAEGGPSPLDIDGPAHVEEALESGTPEAAPEPPFSDRMTGRIAVGLVIVSGPGAVLTFSAADQTKVVAEVQNGLSWLSSRSPARDVTFVHDIRPVSVTAQETATGDGFEAFEAPWRDAGLVALGLPAGTAGIRSYARQMRAAMHTDWAYVAFFTKYRLFHFAYAVRSAPKLIMNFANDNWGVDNIDRVFAHESGHIFGAPDEYSVANCTCGGSHGHFGRPNSNCETCAPFGGVNCIMRANTWEMCAETPYHLGYNGLPQLALPAV